MPHKHKRRKLNSDNDVDLPPSSFAKPLSAGKTPSKPSTLQNGARNAYKNNDTPKAFARLMSFKKTGHGTNGLDDGEPLSKKRKRPAPASSNPPANESTASNRPSTASAAPKILPGESISDFSARVDRALPVAGLATKGKKIEGIRDHRVTKHERRLKRLQENWRKEDARLKARAEEEREEAEEREDEERDLWEERDREERRTKGSRRKVAGREDDEDPWAALKRDKPRGLMDVVQAPPTFTTLPKEKFKVRVGAKVNVADVPSKAGSLRRREELGSTRREVIERYREMMSVKRAGG